MHKYFIVPPARCHTASFMPYCFVHYLVVRDRSKWTVGFACDEGMARASLWMVGNPFRCPMMEGLPIARHPTAISKHDAT